MHGLTFTQMQYRIWAEMVNGSLHADLNNPPSTSLFTRAGNQSVNRKSFSVTQVITEAANVLTSSLLPKQYTSASGSTAASTVIEDRSKLYKQLTELHNLRSTDILTEEEYIVEKETFMGLPKKLKDSTRSVYQLSANM